MRSRDPSRPRRNTPLLIAVIVVVFLLLFEGLLVVTVMISPTATKTLTAKVRGVPEWWNGSEDRPGIPERAKQATSDFWNNQVVTLWKMPEAPSTPATFTECQSCHQDFQTRARFEHVYMNHRLHAQEGIPCGQCHINNEHPGPQRPLESSCAGCHDEVNQTGKCDFCHPPGTIPHFYLMGAPRDGYIDCATCHPSETLPQFGERLVRVGDFTGDPAARCLECHPAGPTPGVPTSAGAARGCKSCHGDPSPHPADWIATHPEVALGAGYNCTQCHTDLWCANACHSNTPTFNPAPLPLPAPVPKIVQPSKLVQP